MFSSLDVYRWHFHTPNDLSIGVVLGFSIMNLKLQLVSIAIDAIM